MEAVRVSSPLGYRGRLACAQISPAGDVVAACDEASIVTLKPLGPAGAPLAETLSGFTAFAANPKGFTWLASPEGFLWLLTLNDEMVGFHSMPETLYRKDLTVPPAWQGTPQYRPDPGGTGSAGSFVEPASEVSGDLAPGRRVPSEGPGTASPVPQIQSTFVPMAAAVPPVAGSTEGPGGAWEVARKLHSVVRGEGADEADLAVVLHYCRPAGACPACFCPGRKTWLGGKIE